MHFVVNRTRLSSNRRFATDVWMREARRCHVCSSRSRTSGSRSADITASEAGRRGDCPWRMTDMRPCTSISIHSHPFLSMSTPYLCIHIYFCQCPSVSISMSILSIHFYMSMSVNVHPSLSKSTNCPSIILYPSPQIFYHQEQTVHCTFLQPGFEAAVHLLMDNLLDIEVDWTEGATLSFHKHKHKHKHLKAQTHSQTQTQSQIQTQTQSQTQTQ
jgi:hypothetical protein